eukprot:TRINITY_DN28072_c0_g1_i1.p1 TRINITY_DN28072_c0_g1~~TRINITY_DN28072_c0_g1_i1.p1  ORF type:complete len:169 (+),score=26.17 TRINITY_DN28072_c0_g1_i1:204-710(+)
MSLSRTTIRTSSRNDEDAIFFYQTRGQYGCFSNFSRHKIYLPNSKGVSVSWPTTEHYFQAMKFPGHSSEEEIRNATSPGSAAKMGRSRSRPLRKDWESVKIGIMEDALMAKFTQHLDCRDILLETAERHLVENTANDSYWADGGDGSGRNQLGISLMNIRDQIKANLK